MNKPFICIMAASAAIHFAALYFIEYTTPATQVLVGHQSVSVTLTKQQKTKVIPKPKHKPAPVKRAVVKPTPIVKPRKTYPAPVPRVERPKEMVAQHTEPEQPQPAPELEEVDTVELPTQTSKEEISLVLGEKLHKYFYYPLKAKRKGWQGQVILQVKILPSGKIDDVSVATSSGYKTLDRAAIKSMMKVPSISDITLADSTTIKIPVLYKLV